MVAAFMTLNFIPNV